MLRSLFHVSVTVTSFENQSNKEKHCALARIKNKEIYRLNHMSLSFFCVWRFLPIEVVGFVASPGTLLKQPQNTP